MSSDSKRQVTVEFGYAESLVSHALSKQDFADEGDLIEYLDYCEDELRRETEEKDGSLMLYVKKRNDYIAFRIVSYVSIVRERF